MYLLLIKFILINIIASIIFIDGEIFRFILKLLYTPGGAKFMMLGFNMEYNTRGNILDLIGIRLVTFLYLIFSVPLNILYVSTTAHKYYTPWYNQLYNITINPLVAPMLECSWLNGMNAAFNDQHLFMRLQDKLYWNDLFEESGVLTPKIVGIIKNGVVTKNKYYRDGVSYIVKPCVGGLGNGISSYNENSVPLKGKYIIQERVNQTETKGHFRIVTISDGDTYHVANIYMCLNGTDKIASNNHAGGKCHSVDINTNMVRYMGGKETDQLNKYFSIPLLKRAILTSVELHKTLPNYIVTVGWDIMLTKAAIFFLEGNVPSGTVLETDRMYYQKAVPINREIYNAIFNH